jgi:O-acetyl-ADP-ribose deacetylase (regulator of RNase III)
VPRESDGKLAELEALPSGRASPPSSEQDQRVTPTAPMPQSNQPRALRFGRTTVSVAGGTVFSVPAEAIAIPANRRGMMVAGSTGQVRLRGGVTIERDLMHHAPLTLGTSVATTSGDLETQGVRLILHAVVYDDLGGTTRLDIVQRAIAAVLESADRHRVRSLVLPPIGAGVGQGRLSLEDVYATVVGAIAAHLRRYTSRIDQITIVCPDPRDTRTVFSLLQESHAQWWRMKTGS